MQGVNVDFTRDAPFPPMLVVVIEQVLGDRAEVGSGVVDVVALLKSLQQFEAGLLGQVLDVLFAGETATKVSLQAVDAVANDKLCVDVCRCARHR